MQSFGSVFWVLLDSKHSTLKHTGYISLKQIFMYLCIQKTTQENHIYTTFQKWMFYLWEIEAFQIIQEFFQVEPYVFMAKCNCWIIVSNPVCQTTKHQNLVSDLKLTKKVHRIWSNHSRDITVAFNAWILLDQWQQWHCTHKKPVSFIPRRSLLEFVEPENHKWM